MHGIKTNYRLNWPAFLVVSASLTCLAVMFPTRGCSLALAAKPDKPQLDDFALDSDFSRIGCYLIGNPDFTGNPKYEIHEIRAENIGGPGDRSKSSWHAWEGALDERPIGPKDYAHCGNKTAEHPQGFAKGHQNCAGDNSQSQDAMDDTHSTANCVWQDQAFNAQSWERKEKRGRDLALLANKLKIRYRIVSIEIPLYCPGKQHTRDGAITSDVSLTTHGENMLWEPTHLAAVFYVEWAGKTWTECYLFSNSADVAHDDINDHVEAIDTVEKFCNRDIFKNVKRVAEGMEASTARPPDLADLEDGK